MPSALTHFGFNKEVLDSNIEFLKDNEDIYLLGAQGPDPFFFYGAAPMLKAENGKEVREYGTVLHKVDPSKVFSFFFEHANNSKHKDILYSYILGAGLHYILDRRVHPYVFYRTGFGDNSVEKYDYFADHSLFETHLDVLLMEDRYKEYKVPAYMSVECDEEKVEEVSEMYAKLAKEVMECKYIEEDTFEESWKHMYKIEKLLYSKTGVKKWCANTFFRRNKLNTMMHPLTVKDNDRIDYLNLGKDEWQDPSTGKVLYSSVYDLIEESIKEASIWKEIVNRAYNGKDVERELEVFTQGYIYDGYLFGEKMKVFKSAYRKGKR